MSQLLFAAWVVASLVLFLPLGMLLRLARRLVRRDRGVRQSPAPAGVAIPPGETEASPPAGDMEAAELGLPVGATPERPAARSTRNLIRPLSPVLSFLLYLAFIAGAVYFVPQILSWVLDTPHPMAAVSSQSMWPTLKKGDLIFVNGVDKVEDLAVGDIIAFEHPKGITVHRVVEVRGDLITTKGDANPVEDKPIRFDQVVGRILTIGGRLAKLPYVGSIGGLLATQAGQSPDEQESPTGESSGALAPSEAESPPAPKGPVSTSPGTIELVSVDSAGNQANGFSTQLAISADGRFITFVSVATNLAPGDTNDENDIFIHDRQTGITERVSVDSAGNQADGSSDAPAISANGRFVTFVSTASNLVPADINGETDILVHNRQTGITERVSIDSAGNQADGSSEGPAISADGRFVAFVSAASNLVPSDTNRESDVFVHDRQTRATERVSVDSAGSQADGSSAAPAISPDGRFVAFESKAGNLVPGDTNGESDIFIHDRETGITQRVSVDSAGSQADGSNDAPAISADGRFVAFESKASNLVPRDFNRRQDVFVHDLQTGTTERVSVDSTGNQASGPTDAPAISADGRFVAFQAGHANLVPGDTNRRQDVFVHDRQTGITEQVSVDGAGYQGNDHSGLPSISGDGRFIAFWSLASNLVSGDTSLSQDVFVHGWEETDANE